MNYETQEKEIYVLLHEQQRGELITMSPQILQLNRNHFLMGNFRNDSKGCNIVTEKALLKTIGGVFSQIKSIKDIHTQQMLGGKK